ncbi:MAG TPA: YbhN family protein [Acidimicrobiia bacterium]|nr:YbhN family protein [Acidimicrobiia bacterium]
MKSSSSHRARRRTLRIAFQIFAVALAVHLIWPRIAGFKHVGAAFARGSPVAIVALVVFEAASLLSYGELVRVVLRSMGQDVSQNLVQRTTIVGTSLGRTLPGGTTAAMAVVVGALRRAGLDAVRATAALAASGMLSSFVLALLLVPAVVLAIVGGDSGSAALSVAVVAAAIVAVVVGIIPAVRNPAAAGNLVERLLGRVPARFRAGLDPAAVGGGVQKAVEGVRELAHDRHALRWGLAWATANWLFDVAALTAVAVTVGRGTPLTAVLLAYVIGQLAAAVPLTPGGIGIVESAMIASFVAAGAPVAAATATVLGWRLFSFWLPILVGLSLFPTLSRHVAGEAEDETLPG